MIYYYEFHDNSVNYFGSKYLRLNSRYDQHPKMLIYSANRIWAWNPTSNFVTWVKNRYTSLDSAVDQKEFLLVQIQATQYGKSIIL